MRGGVGEEGALEMQPMVMLAIAVAAADAVASARASDITSTSRGGTLPSGLQMNAVVSWAASTHWRFNSLHG